MVSTRILYMLTGFVLSVIIFSTWTSCKQTSFTDYDKKILGDWKIRDGKINNALEPLVTWSRMSHTTGFEFLPGGICEKKGGFFKNRKFYGTTTTYVIEQDCLKVFDPATLLWKGFRIVGLNADSLTLQYQDTSYLHFSKLSYPVNDSVLFDQVIVSSTGCYGKCPVAHISIHKNGDVYYLGKSFTTKRGFYKSQIDKKTFSKIERAFIKADIVNLENRYAASYTDNETIYITFVKNNRLIKTISDYGHVSPLEFQWAYFPLRYLYQRVPLDSIGDTPVYMDSNSMCFETDHKIGCLYDSESFYLYTLLLQAKIVEKEFKRSYISTNKKIKTDGRFYSIHQANGSNQTVDIGFNFIKENHLDELFKPEDDVH